MHAQNNSVGTLLDGYFNNCYWDALVQMASIWITPDLGSIPETASNELVLIRNLSVPDEFVTGIENTILRAPPQFGLTAMGAYLAKEYWKNSDQSGVGY